MLNGLIHFLYYKILLFIFWIKLYGLIIWVEYNIIHFFDQVL